MILHPAYRAKNVVNKKFVTTVASLNAKNNNPIVTINVIPDEKLGSNTHAKSKIYKNNIKIPTKKAFLMKQYIQ